MLGAAATHRGCLGSLPTAVGLLFSSSSRPPPLVLLLERLGHGIPGGDAHSFAWETRSRRLALEALDYVRNMQTGEALIELAMIRLPVARL